MNASQTRYLLVANGKAAGNPELREGVNVARQGGMSIDVQVTWEARDAVRFARDAQALGFTHVIAGGGDGTVNEVVNGLMMLPKAKRPILGVVPLGSANDFANSIGLPLAPDKALRAVVSLSVQWVDVVQVSFDPTSDSAKSYYLNMATGGFGAEISSSTPKALKRVLRGHAYSVMGALKAWRHYRYRADLCWEGAQQQHSSLLMLALGNARQAGGGQVLAPQAKLDDGLLDVLLVKEFPSVKELPQLVRELRSFPAEGQLVNYFTASWFELSTYGDEPPWPLALDGETHEAFYFRAEVVPRAIQVAMPSTCPMLSSFKPA
ncbi:lipid kinase YegS [Halomonas sediminis]